MLASLVLPIALLALGIQFIRWAFDPPVWMFNMVLAYKESRIEYTAYAVQR